MSTRSHPHPAPSSTLPPSALVRVVNAVWSTPPLLPLGLLALLARWSLRAAAVALLAAMGLALLTFAGAVLGGVRDARLSRRAARRHPTDPDPSHRIVTVYSHPTRRGYVVTVDDLGGVRTGPIGAWWAELRPRPHDRAGLGIEIPTARAWAWNLTLIAAEAALMLYAHVVAGVPWTTLFAGVGAVLAAGVAGLVYVARRPRRRPDRAPRSATSPTAPETRAAVLEDAEPDATDLPLAPPAPASGPATSAVPAASTSHDGRDAA